MPLATPACTLLHADTPAGQQPAPTPFHWAITACDRPHWGRYLATTLLTGLLGGARPTTITVVWCRHYNASLQLPSIVYNLRHSSGVKFMFLPKEFPEHALSSVYTALSLPEMYKQPDVPLVITENDVVMAPNFHADLTKVHRWHEHSRQMKI